MEDFNEATDNVEDKGTDESKEPKQPEISEEIKEKFLASKAEGKDEDSIKIDMLSAGAPFKKVTKFFNQLMIENGFAASKEDKASAVKEAVEQYDINSKEGFESAVSSVTEGVDGVTDKSAASLIRGYAKKNEIGCYKKPKGESVGRSTFWDQYLAALAENPQMTAEEATDFIKEHGNKSNVKNITRLLKIQATVNAVAS